MSGGGNHHITQTQRNIQMSKQTNEVKVNAVKSIMDEYKAWRKEFNAKWDALREKQRQEAKAYKEQFEKWQSELDKKIAERDAALAKAPKAEKPVETKKATTKKPVAKKPMKKAAAQKVAKAPVEQKAEAPAEAQA